MKQVIRYGVWETNSSSAHTICLKGNDKEPEEVLGDAPKELLDWVRKEGFYIGREETFKYPSSEIEKFEFKLSSAFTQIASNSDMFDHLWRNKKSSLTPRDLICEGKFYKVFEKLVRELGFKVVVGDISYDTWQYYFSDLDGISSDSYIWSTYLGDDSYFREDWESSLSTLFLRYLFSGDDDVVLFDGEDWETNDIIEKENLRVIYSERY